MLVPPSQPCYSRVHTAGLDADLTYHIESTCLPTRVMTPSIWLRLFHVSSIAVLETCHQVHHTTYASVCHPTHNMQITAMPLFAYWAAPKAERRSMTGHERTPDEVAEILQSYSTEEASKMLAFAPDTGTVRRRQHRSKRVFPVISRSGRTYREATGRLYGETGPASQRQADAGFWRVGAAVRRDLLPMTVAVGGTVRRIWEVAGWTQDSETGKWVADLVRQLNDADLEAGWPDYPYRIGDDCPTTQGRAYRPETY